MMGPGQKLWFGIDFGKFPLKRQIFQLFPVHVKKNLSRSGQKVPGSASYLLRVKSKLGSGQGPSLITTHFFV